MNKQPFDIGMMSLFISAGAVIAASCAYIYIYAQAQTLSDKAILARDVVAAEKASEANGTDLISMFDSTASARAALPSLFVKSDRVVDFIKSIENVGRQSGASVSISSISADPASGPAWTTGKVSASVAASGSWSQIMTALGLFENLPFASSLDSASLSASAQSGNNNSAAKPSWTLSFDIEAAMLIVASSTHQ
ncbi:MAG: hypothetical protein KGI49_03615 [Patescibacteria group bacterium]|nr:hypothetical protein [Patescibacteria group bacterium]